MSLLQDEMMTCGDSLIYTLIIINKMKTSMKSLGLSLLVWCGMALASCSGSKYEYATVPNDPMNAKIYTLDNGLKVYMTVNKEKPRIQTYIAVRVGSKNDPAETTGLAHYLEHLMFKGSENFGTVNYEAEKPLLDAIEAQFEIYRNTTDEAERKAIYRVIDSLSYEASTYFIPNEYDKLMTAIGASGTNAYTGNDVTCYVENIPSNQIENWAKIQADRFENMVIRGFHTELETVYEERNMYSAYDSEKVFEAMMSALFPNHPYGTQTTIGSQEHLKNPSITNIKNYFAQWYVPNNMAICLSGDFNPDEMVEVIEKYFGGMKPNPNLPVLEIKEETPISIPVVREVWGLEAESIMLGWRTPKYSDADADAMDLLCNILYNGQAGLVDLNLNQQQKVLSSYAGLYLQADHGMLLMAGNPKTGQSLDEVKELLLAQIEKLRKGEFDENLIQATVNNYKLAYENALESNGRRADSFVQSFVNGSEWADEVTQLDRLAALTKEELVAMANRYLGMDNYVAVYKRMGKDPNEKIIAKPAITPIKMNRDTASVFLNEVVASVVEPIEPVFVDFEKDMSILKAQSDIEVLYKQNTTNRIFQLEYIFDMGDYHDKALSMAALYLEYLGTSDMTPEEVKRAFYDMACGFSVNPSKERTYLSLSGLHENMPKAIALFEKLLSDAQVNAAAYTNLVNDELKARLDAKLDQDQNFARLSAYAEYGPKNPYTHILSEKELKAMKPQELVDRIHALNGYKHRVLYYGPASQEELLALLKAEHKVPETLKEVPAAEPFVYQTTDKTRIFVAPYVAQQTYISQFSNRNEAYDVALETPLSLYNEYFDGNMGAIVFQEMRESRGLAYGASARFMLPDYKKYPFMYYAMISTQTDKMMDAIGAFDEIINDMPQSEAAFDLAKNGAIDRLRTQRINKSSVLWEYVDAQDMGVTINRDKAYYDFLQTATLQDVVKFQQQWVKGRTYHFAILGDKKHLDMKALKKMGEVIELSTEDIFGY